MSDQADRLRQWLDATAAGEPSARRARLTLVAGGKGGVGTTAVAANLAAVAAAGGSNCLLVDADFGRADLTQLCGLVPRYGIGDLLAGHAELDRLLVEHRAGMRVLPAKWAPEIHTPEGAAAEHRLEAALESLCTMTDRVIVDAGNTHTSWTRLLWALADDVLFVTTPAHTAVMNTYAALKACWKTTESSVEIPQISLLVNRAKTAEAATTQQRLTEACHRFMGIFIADAGHLPECTSLLIGSRLHQLAVELADEALVERLKIVVSRTFRHTSSVAPALGAVLHDCNNSEENEKIKIRFNRRPVLADC